MTQRHMQAVLDDYIAATGVPGVAASLFTRDGIVSQAGSGVASLEAPSVPMTAATVSIVYSLSKIMTATALGVLAAAGRIDFDEPVAGYLPDVPGRDRFEAITLRHLLSHTAGLVHGPVPPTAPISTPDPLERYVLGACLGADRLGLPGEVFGYSDIGILIAGYVVQRVTGKPFADAMAGVLFGPAAMSRTTLDPLVAMTYPLAQQHVRAPDGDILVRRRFDVAPARQPSSGAFSCAEDLARLGVLHLGGNPGGDLGGGEILPDAARAELHRPVADVGLDIVRSFGLTLTVGPWHGDALSVGHEGYHDGAWVKLLMLPCLGIGGAWIDNRGIDPTIEHARQSSFDRLLAMLGAGPRSWRRPDEPADLDPAVASGQYRHGNGKPISLTATNDGLRACDGTVTVGYRHLSGRVFVAAERREDLPDRIPWAPDKDSSRSALAVAGPADAPTHILLNGLPYQRS